MAGQRHSWKQFMDRAPKYACFVGYLLLETEIDIDKVPDPKNIMRRQLSSHLQTCILRILLVN